MRLVSLLTLTLALTAACGGVAPDPQVELAETTAEASSCRWRVRGWVKVRDNLWNRQGNATATADRGLQGAKVIIEAATVPGFFQQWGVATINASGYYARTVRPAQSDPIGCALPRYFRATLRLEDSRVKIAPELLPAFPAWIWPLSDETVARRPGLSGGRRTVTLSRTFTNITDHYPDNLAFIPGTTGALHNFTRAAQMFYGLRKVRNHMASWGLNPIKVNVIWPSGVGSDGDWGFSDPVVDHVRIRKAWFHKTKRDGSLDWDWVQRELTHEYIHQWQNARSYEPFFGGGRTAGTHDFFEPAALTLYEELAEYATKAIHESLFGWSYSWRVYTRASMFQSFANASTEVLGPYFETDDLIDLVEADSTQWRSYLDEGAESVLNHLNLLVKPDWFGYDYSADYGASSGGVAQRRGALPRDCSAEPEPLLSKRQVVSAYADWRGDRGGHIPTDQRSLSGFYDYLGQRYPHFAARQDLVHSLGNPHFAQPRGDGGTRSYDTCAPLLRQGRFSPSR